MSEAVLEIESIAAGGDGVARADGLVVFVPRTAPGDKARVSYTQRGAFARGEVVELLSPSQWRTPARCVHYDGDKCGGCQLQHVEYTQQLESKRRIVSDALQRIGRRDVPQVAIRGSAREWEYRRKLTLEIRRDGEVVRAGLHRYDRPDSIFSLRECPITMDEVLRAWREILAQADLLPRARTLRGSVLHLDDGGHFSVGGGTAWGAAGQLGDSCPSLRSIWWTAKGGQKQLVYERDAASRTGASFAQINDAVANELRDHVLKSVSDFSARDVVDAYSGSGDLSLVLAARGTRVTAIEVDAEAVAAFSEMLAPPSRAICAWVEDEIAKHLPSDLVILNPPRAGLDPKVSAALNHGGAARSAIVYISCNPATLARDVARLSQFEVKSTVAFDMFPQTSHVETVCVLTPTVVDR